MAGVIGLWVGMFICVFAVALLIGGLFIFIGAKLARVKDGTYGRSVKAALLTFIFLIIVGIPVALVSALARGGESSPILGSALAFVLSILVVKRVFKTTYGKALLVSIIAVVAETVAVWAIALAGIGIMAPLAARVGTPEITPRGIEDEGMPPLMEAAAEGNIDTVKTLLKAGADPDARFLGGATALMAAAQEGRTDVCETLIADGADVNTKGPRGWTALMLAAHGGQTETAEALLANDADINVKANDGETALMTAAFKGQSETVRALLINGADVNAKDNDGMTALMAAAATGRAETVKALLINGADVNVKDNDGSTALILAAQEGHTGIVLLLRGAGAKE